MSELEQRILDLLAEPGAKPLRPAALARRLNVTKKHRDDFRDALDRLIAAGKLREGKKGRLRPRDVAGMIAGIVKRVSTGAGYLRPHESPPDVPAGEIYIDPADMRDAHTGDEVLVRLTNRQRRDGKRSGRIEEILVRATNTFVGTYLERGGQGYVEVDGGTFHDPVLVGDPGAKGARPNDKVVIEMLRFPSHVRAGEAVLTAVLGPRGAPGVDTLSIIHEFGLRDAFSDDVLENAREQAEQFDENRLAERVDLTRDTIVTIDPIDARDFDDAISLTQADDGSWRLGVHIADVAHFVSSGSPLDGEARIRGTSVYLPDRVLPMLPEVISNGLASLQQGKVRYTQSVFIEYTADGVPVHTEFARSAIRVAWRFAYEDVLALVEGRRIARVRDVPKEIRELVRRMHGLAMLLRRRRMASGALDLSLREVKIDFNESGAVTGAHEVAHDESHQLIEEFMLAANIAVATALDDRGIAFMRRGHAEPDLLKLRNLSEFATALGYPLKRFQSRRDVQDLLKRVAGTPHEHAINYAVLRSLKQAEYTAQSAGHYALGVEQYCHFTSPIRRYPDLTVHRTVADVLFDRKHARGDDVVALAKLARSCSIAERQAQQAERELVKVKLLTFFVDKIGLEMDATITGVERFGLFCQGTEIPVDGLIHITALANDYYDFDAATFSLVGRRGGRQFRLGDHLRVSVAHVDVDRRELDFRVVGEGQPAERKPLGKKGADAKPDHARPKKPRGKKPPVDESSSPHHRERKRPREDRGGGR